MKTFIKGYKFSAWLSVIFGCGLLVCAAQAVAVTTVSWDPTGTNADDAIPGPRAVANGPEDSFTVALPVTDSLIIDMSNEHLDWFLDPNTTSRLAFSRPFNPNGGFGKVTFLDMSMGVITTPLSVDLSWSFPGGSVLAITATNNDLNNSALIPEIHFMELAVTAGEISASTYTTDPSNFIPSMEPFPFTVGAWIAPQPAPFAVGFGILGLLGGLGLMVRGRRKRHA